MRRLAKIEIETDSLIDGKLEGRGLRPAAEGQGHCETRQANEEHSEKRAGQNAAQHRPFEKPPAGAFKLDSEAHPLGWDRLPALKDQPDPERQVEEHVAEDHTRKPVDGYLGQMDESQKLVQQPRTPEDRNQTKNRDNYWQDERRTKKGDKGATAHKPPPRQGTGNGDRKANAQSR